MSKAEDISSHLQPAAIARTNKHLRKIINYIKDTQNPFDSSIDPNHLFNISNGKAASQEVEYFSSKFSSCWEKSDGKFFNRMYQ